MEENKKNVDKKLRLRAILIWCLVAFLFIYVLEGFFMPREAFSEVETVLKKAVIAGVGAVPIGLLLYYLILPKMDKQNNIMKDIMLDMEKNGISERLVARMREQFDWCRAKKTYVTYQNFYALHLAAYYLDLNDYRESGFYLNAMDLEALFANRDTISVQRSIASYYMVNTLYTIKCSGIEKAGNQIIDTENYYHQNYGKDPYLDILIDSFYLEYFVLSGRDAEAIPLGEKYLNREKINFTAFLSLALAYSHLGNSEKADEYTKLAKESATDEYHRKVFQAWLGDEYGTI